MNDSSRRTLGEGMFIGGLGAGILALIPTQVKMIPGLVTNMSPAFMPRFVGLALILIGLLSCLQAFISKNSEKHDRIVRKEMFRIILSTILLVSYAVLFPIIGFVSTSALYAGIFSYFFGQRNLLKLGVVVSVVPTIVWILFEKVFTIPLPHGMLY